jgi:hypothetical protein
MRRLWLRQSKNGKNLSLGNGASPTDQPCVKSIGRLVKHFLKGKSQERYTREYDAIIEVREKAQDAGYDDGEIQGLLEKLKVSRAKKAELEKLYEKALKEEAAESKK